MNGVFVSPKALSKSGATSVARLSFAVYSKRKPVIGSRGVGVTRISASVVAALNAGVAACRAPLVARMDADDLMHRERLAAQAAAFAEDPELAAVGCHVRLFPRRELGPGMRAYERWLASVDSPRRVREEAFVECPLAHPTLVARTVYPFNIYAHQCWTTENDQHLLVKVIP